MELIGFRAVAALTLAGVLRMKKRHARRSATPLGLDPADAAELDAIAQRVLWERLGERSSALAARLRLVLTRGVPPRGLAPVAEGQPWRLTFADGTVVAVTAPRRADLVELLLCLSLGEVTLVGHRFVGDDVVLAFASGDRVVRVTAVGVP